MSIPSLALIRPNCTERDLNIKTLFFKYRSADKSLARPTSRCILLNGENISFDASLVIYINSTNIPPIMIINRIYESQNLLSLVSFLVGLRTYQNPRKMYGYHTFYTAGLEALKSSKIHNRYWESNTTNWTPLKHTI